MASDGAKLGQIDDQLAVRIHAVNDGHVLNELCVALSSTRDASEARAVLDRLAPNRAV
jgi:hypothetical protein